MPQLLSNASSLQICVEESILLATQNSGMHRLLISALPRQLYPALRESKQLSSIVIKNKQLNTFQGFEIPPCFLEGRRIARDFPLPGGFFLPGMGALYALNPGLRRRAH